jgi:hypothetical protein
VVVLSNPQLSPETKPSLFPSLARKGGPSRVVAVISLVSIL